MNIIWKATLHMTKWGCINGVMYGLLYVIILLGYPGDLLKVAIPYGLFGAILGGIAGIAINLINGVILGLATHLWFHSLADPLVFRRRACLFCASVTFIGAVTGFGILFAFIIDGAMIFFLFVIIPALIASLAAANAAERFVYAYAKVKRPLSMSRRDELFQFGDVRE